MAMLLSRLPPSNTCDIIAMIGTSDQSCWLAEACKILLLLHTDILNILIIPIYWALQRR